MSIIQSYGGFGESLLTLGGDRALAIEVRQSIPQRPVYASAAVSVSGGTTEFAKVILYVGSLTGLLQSLAVESGVLDPYTAFGLTRLLAVRAFPVNSGSCELSLPPFPVPLFQAQANETLGCAVLIADTAALVPVNCYATLTFYGIAVDANINNQYKLV